jgi:predicted ABC-type ATPase
MFAGPNGSGESVLKSHLPPSLLGVYLNPVEIEMQMRVDGELDLRSLGVETTPEEVLLFFRTSAFLKTAGLADTVKRLCFSDGRVGFRAGEVNAYLASVTVDFLRMKLLEQKVTFTFETVMSHPSKVSLLKQARHAGYRTYLYYVATDDPAINVSRVANRVALGGHAVPEDKIVERYHRSLGLLMDALRHVSGTSRSPVAASRQTNFQKHGYSEAHIYAGLQKLMAAPENTADTIYQTNLRTYKLLHCGVEVQLVDAQEARRLR